MSKKINKMKIFKNPKAFNMILNSVRLSEGEIIIWRLLSDKKVTARVHLKVIRKQKGELLLEVKKSDVEKADSVIANGDKVNFFLPNEGLLFQAKVKDYTEEKKLLIATPEEYSQIDRRKYIRTRITDESVSFETTINNGLSQRNYKKSIFDLSAGGFSILAGKGELRDFYRDLKLKKVFFMMGTMKFPISAQIVNIIELQPGDFEDVLYKCYKISFEFTELHEKAKECINHYVFEYLSPSELSVPSVD